MNKHTRPLPIPPSLLALTLVLLLLLAACGSGTVSPSQATPTTEDRTVTDVAVPPEEAEIEAILTDMDSLAAEIGRKWQGEESAVSAVQGMRREL